MANHVYRARPSTLGPMKCAELGMRVVSLLPRSPWLEDAGSNSVIDRLNTLSLSLLNAVHHGFERFGGVPLPIRDLARDP